MNIQINGYNVEIDENQSNINGLKLIPQIKNFGNEANDADGLPFTHCCSQEVSDNNFNLAKELTKKYAKKNIVEIGINRNGSNSFTWAMINNKSKDVKYLGIDLDDKSEMNSLENNIFTIRANSFDQIKIRDYIKNIGIDEISILFIDGNHSVNAVINDWKYTDFLSKDGIVVFHDTNYHPGPRILIESIDEKLYRIEKYFSNDSNDYGMGVAYRIV